MLWHPNRCLAQYYFVFSSLLFLDKTTAQWSGGFAFCERLTGNRKDRIFVVLGQHRSSLNMSCAGLILISQVVVVPEFVIVAAFSGSD